MKVKVFQPNSHGKIEFTRAEPEKLLNEVYDGGFRDGEAAQREKSTWTWTSPYIYNNDSYTTTTSSPNIPLTINSSTTQPIDKLTCTQATDTNKNRTSIATGATLKTTPDGTITVSSIDNEIVLNPGDVFTNLAKELNF